MLIYSAVIASSYDRQTEIYTCGSFFNEEDAMIAVVKKALANNLINRERYLDVLKSASMIVPNDHSNLSQMDQDLINELKEIQNMSDAQFSEMVCKKVLENPTIDNLSAIMEIYDEDYTREWDFRIECQYVTIEKVPFNLSQALTP